MATYRYSRPVLLAFSVVAAGLAGLAASAIVVAFGSGPGRGYALVMAAALLVGAVSVLRLTLRCRAVIVIDEDGLTEFTGSTSRQVRWGDLARIRSYRTKAVWDVVRRSGRTEFSIVHNWLEGSPEDVATEIERRGFQISPD